MIYTNDFAFIHIPKTGGTSIKFSILKNCEDAKWLPEERPMVNFTGDKDDWRVVQHLPYSHWEDLLGDRWVFSVVRDPFVRAISYYVYLTKTMMCEDKFKSLSFEEIFDVNKKSLNVSNKPQTDFLLDKNNKLIKNIFKYENGFSEIENHISFEIDERVNTNPLYNYLDYYDEKRERLIRNIFEKDFENFSYRDSLP